MSLPTRAETHSFELQADFRAWSWMTRPSPSALPLKGYFAWKRRPRSQRCRWKGFSRRLSPLRGEEIYVTDFWGSAIYLVEEPSPRFDLGFNGLLVDGGRLLASVTDYGRIRTISLENNSSAGELSVLLEDPALIGLEGVDLDDEGRIVAANLLREQIVCLDREGNAEELRTENTFAPSRLRRGAKARTVSTNVSAPVPFLDERSVLQPGLVVFSPESAEL